MRRTSILAGLPVCLALLSSPAPAQGSCLWGPATDGPVMRFEAGSAVIDGRLLLFGGFEPGLIAATRVDAYDPVTDNWYYVTDLPQATTHAGLAVDGRDIWIAGGFLGPHPGPVIDNVWAYDVDLNAWSPGPTLPAPRGSGGLFRIDRTLHFVGGVPADRNTDQDEHWVLDLDNPTGWVLYAPLPIARNHFASISFAGRGYVIGGQFGHDNSPTDVDLVHVYDPQTGWSQLASLPFPRSHCESATFPVGGSIVLAGGRSNVLGKSSLDELTAYDPASDTWSNIGKLPTKLIGPAAKVIGQELILSAGGSTPVALLADTWRQPADGGHQRINCGGNNVTLSEPWCADTGFVGGRLFTNNGLGPVAGTVDDELYETERSGTTAVPDHFAYSIPLLGGDYLVRLHFAEIFWGAPGGAPGGVGKRVFDVTLEGQLVLDDYDIFADVGAATAVVHTYHRTVTDGSLDISFDSSVDRPKVSGIEVIPLSTDGSYCVAAPNSAGNGALVSWVGSTRVPVNDFSLAATGLPPQAKGLYLQSAVQNQAPFASGFLCVSAPLYRLAGIVQAGPQGNTFRALDLLAPNPAGSLIIPGSTWNFQLWYRDKPASTSNLSNGLSLTFAP